VLKRWIVKGQENGFVEKEQGLVPGNKELSEKLKEVYARWKNINDNW